MAPLVPWANQSIKFYRPIRAPGKYFPSPWTPIYSDSFKMKDDSTSYDQVPYTINAYAMTHPCHLAMVARLFGVEATDPSRARVLEIGCGHGGNILPMAEQLPESNFVAIDLSETQINNARTMAEAAKLDNIELIQKDLTTIDKDFGEFDYIIVHGVYSWVPDEVKTHLLRICGENLTPNGVAFVSYNTYPGWRVKESIRDMLLIHTERFEDPNDIIKNAKGLLKFLEEAAKKQNTPYSKLIQNELEFLQNADPHYLFHDTLELNNNPVYFRDFHKRAVEKGLTYLGDSTVRTMLANDIDPEIRATLEKATGDIVTREQYLDFLRNRTFRQSLLCKQGVSINRTIQPESMKAFRYRSLFASQGDTDLRDGMNTEYASASGLKINVKQALEKAVLHELQKATPKFLSYEELVNRAKHSLDGVIDDDRFNALEKALYASLFNLCNTGGVTALAHCPDIVDHISEKPLVSKLGRIQAELGLSITNRYHGNCKLEAFQNQIVTFLNGENSPEEVINTLLSSTSPDKLQVKQDGKVIDDPEQLRAIYTAKVNQVLSLLAANALLIG